MVDMAEELTMPVLADFNIVVPEDPQSVPIQGGQRSQVGKSFNAGGRVGEGVGQTGSLAAFIMFSVLNLQVPLDVFVNGTETGSGPIGTMDPNPPGSRGWYSQVICMSGGRLRSGEGANNALSVALPPGSPVPTSSFMIKNLVCFYHQDAD
jgi:hypothetical protein